VIVVGWNWGGRRSVVVVFGASLMLQKHFRMALSSLASIRTVSE
jgi:hypothetical protein